MKKLLFILIVLLAGFGVAITPAGTVIRNQAKAVLENEEYLSNEVNTVVKAICVPALSPNGTVDAPGQIVTTGPNQLVFLPYVLTNAGNAPYVFALGWAQHAGAAWSPETVTFYQDINSNGERDNGEPQLSSIELGASESVSLVAEVLTPATALGDTYVTPFASCDSGEVTTDNYALIRVVNGPALQVLQSVSKQQVQGNDVIRFDIRLINNGSATARDVTIHDDFSAGTLEGLVYEPGSLSSSEGEAEFFDGNRWTLTEPDTVEGVRLRIDSVDVAEQIILSFDMRVLVSATPGTRQNSVTVSGPDSVAQATIDFEVLPTYQHHLGPMNNPEALPGGEASSSDKQQLEVLVYAQQTCFSHTLLNAANVQDSFSLSTSNVPDGVNVTLLSTTGEPLSNPLTLAAAEQLSFDLCVIAASVTDAFTITLRATSLHSGTENITIDEVMQVIVGDNLFTEKTADKQDLLALNDTITYTLTVRNDNSIDLHDVVINDKLQDLIRQSGAETPEGVQTTFVSASQGGVYNEQTRTISWQFDTLSVGQTLTLNVQVRAPADVPEGTIYTLPNDFTVDALELAFPLRSNEVLHVLPETEIMVEKTVDVTEVSVGDVVAYTVSVFNPTEITMALDIRDVLPERTQLVEGSAMLTLGAYSEARQPEVQDGVLRWDLREDDAFTLQPKGDSDRRDVLVITYELLLLSGAEGDLSNVVQISGHFTDGVLGSAVANAEAQASVRVTDSSIPPATLLGRVYFDKNENGRFDTDDLALPGARIILANGQQAMSDANGNYGFRDLRPGVWSIMLDKNSAPFTPLAHPEALDDGYQHRVALQGVTVSDFPLAFPAGGIDASRRTTLIIGPLRVDKWLLPLETTTRVILELQSDVALPELLLLDPVPGQDAKVFRFELFEGRDTLMYDVLQVPMPLTDPDASWRYP